MVEKILRYRVKVERFCKKKNRFFGREILVNCGKFKDGNEENEMNQ